MANYATSKDMPAEPFIWADLFAQFYNEDVPLDQTFDDLVARQCEIHGHLDKPCPEASELLGEWTLDGKSCRPMWHAAVARFTKTPPVLVGTSEQLSNEAASRRKANMVYGRLTLNDAVTFGDNNTPEAQAALDTPITIMQAPTRLTPGRNWSLNSGTVGQLIKNQLSEHPVEAAKDNTAFVYAQGRKARKVTKNGHVTQHAHRIQSEIEAVTAIAGDIDGGDKALRVAERIHELGLMGVAYTTHSHHGKRTEQGDRFRFILFLEEPINFPMNDDAARREAVGAYHARYAGICELLGLTEIDATAMNLHQMMYTPRRASEDAEFEHYVIYGKALRYEDMPIADASKYRKAMKAPSGAALSKKDSSGPAVLSDGFDLAEWSRDGGRYLMIADVLDSIGWDVRGGYGWTEMMCANAARHSDPNDDAAAFTEGEDGFAIHCFHDHCSQLGTWEFLVLIEQAVLNGEAVLPDGVETFSAFLCDPAFYPDEIDGEPVEFDPTDYGVIEEIKINFLGSAKKVERAFDAVAENERAGEDDYAVLYAGVEKAGGKRIAVKKLDELMSSRNANDRKHLKARGTALLKIDKARFAAQAEMIEGTANADHDISASLGDNMADALATLAAHWAVVNVSGKVRLIPRVSADADGERMEFWSIQEFINFHADRKIPTIKNGEPVILDPAKEFAFNAARYRAVVFAPGGSHASDFNIFTGFGVQPQPGDCARLKDFIRDIICDGDQELFKWVWHWMAHMVQRPFEKPGTALVIHGKGRCGKGIFGELLRALVSPYGTLALQPDHVVGQFAGPSLATSLVLTSEEAVFAGSQKEANVLKGMITAKRLRVESKGIQSFEMDSYLRIVMDSNSDHTVQISGDGSEWRFCVMRVSETRFKDTVYFGGILSDIYGDPMRALMHELMEYDPASAGMTWDDVRLAPETDARRQMMYQSQSSAKREVMAMVEAGEVVAKDVEGNVYRTALNDATETRVAVSDVKMVVSQFASKYDANEGDMSKLLEKTFGVPFPKGRGVVKCRKAVYGDDPKDTTRNVYFVTFPPRAELLEKIIAMMG